MTDNRYMMPGVDFARIARWDGLDIMAKAKDRFWYLASPYAKYEGGHQAAADEAARYAAVCINKGIFVFSPIAHAHPISLAPGMSSDAANQHDIWMPLDKTFVDAACGVIIADMPGWRDSKGVGMELDWARSQDKPIFLMRLGDVTTFEWVP